MKTVTTHRMAVEVNIKKRLASISIGANVQLEGTANTIIDARFLLVVNSDMVHIFAENAIMEMQAKVTTILKLFRR